MNPKHMAPFKDPGIAGSDGKLYVDGPADGCGYHHGTLWPERRLSNATDLAAAVAIANEAYRSGYIQAQRDICKALGLGG